MFFEPRNEEKRSEEKTVTLRDIKQNNELSC